MVLTQDPSILRSKVLELSKKTFARPESFTDLKKDEGYELLSRISSLLITQMLKKGVIQPDELSNIY